MKANVLYIERTDFTKAALDVYEKHIKSIFASFGYDASVETYCEKPDQKKIENIINNESIDVIFCDITLGSTMGENSLGLQIIKVLKTKFTEIIICGISGKDIEYGATTSPKNMPTFDLFVNKGRLLEERYIKYIADEMQHLFRSNTEIEVNIDNLPKEEKEFVKKPFFIRLLKQITFTTHKSGVGTNIKTVTLSPTSGGYSSSHVYKMCCLTVNGEKTINSILKCSKKEYAVQEINNYVNYVKWYLPYTWRPEILSYAFGGELKKEEYGMICYSFAYNGENLFSSITDKIEDASDISYAKVDKAIEMIFGSKTQKWYNYEKWAPVPEPINKYYFDIYFKAKDSTRIQPFDEVIKYIMRFDGFFNNEEYHIFNSSFPTAKKLFTDPITGSYRKCICHGDLNTNNILISDENDDLIFIDFQETSEGHVFHDFIVFEMCFRLYNKTGLSLNKLIEIEIEVSKGNFELIEQTNKMWKRIKRIRELAIENFRNDEDIKTYYYGLAMRAFRLFRSHEAFEQWQLEALLAVMLANLKLLY